MFAKLKNYLEVSKMQQKLSVTIKIVCGVFMIAILIAVAGLVSGNNNLISFYYTPYANSKLQLEIRMDMQEAQKEVLWAISTVDAAKRAERIKIAEESAGKVGQGIDKLYYNFSDKVLLEELGMVMQDMATNRSKALELAAQGKREQALHCFENEYVPTVEKVEAALMSFLPF